jgi:hypothetical protein
MYFEKCTTTARAQIKPVRDKFVGISGGATDYIYDVLIE